MATTREYRQRIRSRLNRNVTLQEKAKAAIAERVAEAEQVQHQALLRCAERWGITAEPDTVKPGVWVTRVGEGAPISYRGRNRINLTTPTKCTCKEFRIFHRCPCQAFVIELLKAGEVVSFSALHHRLEQVA